MRTLLIFLLLLASLPSLGQKAPETEPDLVKMMHEAAARGDIGGIEFFLSKGVDVDAPDWRGYTPLMSLLHGDRCWKPSNWPSVIDGIRIFAAAGADLDATARIPHSDTTLTPFNVAAGCQPSPVIDALLDAGATVDSRGGGPAMRNQEAYTLRHLIAIGVDIDGQIDGRTALMKAARLGDLEKVKLLLELGADPSLRDRDSKRAVDLAAELGHTEVVSVLNPGNSVSASVASPLLMKAAAANDVEMMRTLLDAGANPNFRDRDNLGPLYAAIEKGSIDAVRVLVESGADPILPANHGVTPLMQAAGKDDASFLEWIIELIEPSKQALSDALLFTRAGPAVELLLARGADPNHVGVLEYQSDNYIASQLIDGATPLIRATEMGCVPCIDFLIDAGADPAYVGPGVASPLTTMSFTTTKEALERITSQLPPPDRLQHGAIIAAVVASLVDSEVSRRLRLPEQSFVSITIEDEPLPRDLELLLPSGLMLARSHSERESSDSLKILRIEWVRPDLVLAWYSFHPQMRHGHGAIVAVQHGSDGWTVVDRRSTWIS